MALRETASEPKLARRATAWPPLDRDFEYRRQVVPKLAAFPRIPRLQFFLAFRTDAGPHRQLDRLGPIDWAAVFKDDSLANDGTAAGIQDTNAMLPVLTCLAGCRPEDGSHDLEVAFDEGSPRNKAPTQVVRGEMLDRAILALLPIENCILQ